MYCAMKLYNINRIIMYLFCISNAYIEVINYDLMLPVIVTCSVLNHCLCSHVFAGKVVLFKSNTIIESFSFPPSFGSTVFFLICKIY